MFDIYKNTTLDGVTTYVKPLQTVTYNVLNAVPTITITEELVTLLPTGGVITQPCSQIQTSFSNPAMTFNLVDPTTGATTGSMTLGSLHIAMYSLYMYLAALRDAGQL